MPAAPSTRPSRPWWRAAVALFASLAVALPLFGGTAQAAEPKDLSAGRSYTWSEAPDADRPDRGRQLTDGALGALDVTDPAWVGSTKGRTREIVVDLGGSKSITGIRAHFLQDWPSASVLVPLNVSFAVADSPRRWATVGRQATELLWGDGPARDEWFAWGVGDEGVPDRPGARAAYGRFVKISFSVHTRAAQLIDELEVTGFHGRIDGAVTPAPDRPGYLEPGRATAGIRDLALIYNGQYDNDRGNWTADELRPYLARVDRDGRPVGRLFDGVLMLGLLTPSGVDLGSGWARQPDWEWYRDKTFAPGGDLDQLDRAAGQVNAALPGPDRKTKVVLAIPNPGGTLTDFGDVDGDGITENLNADAVGREQALANQEKVVRWWTAGLIERWRAAGYEQLDLVGLYWLPEQIDVGPDGPEQARRVAEVIHDHRLTAFWIPHFLAYKAFQWQEVGLDAAAFQPNYFFEEMDPARIEDAAGIARSYGMGIEVEFDERAATDPALRERLLAYLRGGSRYGYQDAFVAYYQGVDALYRFATSTDPKTRELYDLVADFVAGKKIR
ncbi:DUF4855 domain-containing protein [Microlunatus parietis]|uniref:F5/8 type C domain-containing protein n=1 Tax=Microlunatus parietis TaxID=682979 RepID=A0A7Y9IBG8_9ACTN|nr:DUF4855 domain-containing protein [Microlunatus parietis]NYE73794.1 hypothetical protein [Microlunatus parietis]